MGLEELKPGHAYMYYDPYGGGIRVICLGPPLLSEIIVNEDSFYRGVYQKIQYCDPPCNIEIFYEAECFRGHHYFEEIGPADESGAHWSNAGF